MSRKSHEGKSSESEPLGFPFSNLLHSLHVICAATLGSSTHSPGKAHGEQALHIMWHAWGPISSEYTIAYKGHCHTSSPFYQFALSDTSAKTNL